MNKYEQAKDEEVLAKIIAGGMASKRKILDWIGRSRIGSYNSFGVGPSDASSGPACAVGAGCLYIGIETTMDPLDAFAEAHDVTRSYACGVSDGFESCDVADAATGIWIIDEDKDYARGVAVGYATKQFFGKSGRNGR